MINTQVLGQKSRYAYNVSIENDYTLLFDGLVKYDNETGTSDKFSFGEGRWGSEAPFAPRPGAVAEDDGYLISFVYDANQERSEAVVLDASGYGRSMSGHHPPADSPRLPRMLGS